jgi:hypothetical protein
MMTLISLRLPIQFTGLSTRAGTRSDCCGGKSAYAWSSATTNFVKPAKENWLFMNYWFVILMPIEAIKT